jgi:uncharacterized repeat protein (TIGR01451 family)
MVKRTLALIATLAMVFSTAGISAATQEDTPAQADFTFESSDDFEVVRPDRIKGETEGYWIVRLEDAALATYNGDIAGLDGTSLVRTRKPKIDTKSAAAREYTDYLNRKQDALIAEMTSAFGRTMDVTYRYTNAVNGLTVWLTPSEASQVLRMNGVADIEKNRITELSTDLGPTFIGAPSIWDGSATGVATQGEGILVGIIDSGINPENPSFLATGADGVTIANPYGDGVYVGACDPSNTTQFQPSFTCNSKLVGGYDFFPDDDASGINSLDHDGHGSHTASTTAGNVTEATGPDGGPLMISGVAPHANIISYRTCGDDALGQGYCTSAGAVAAVNQAIADGVDVLNYSVGSPSPGNPWTDIDDLAFLAARAAGIFVAHSAGNEGPAAATTGSPAAPWMAHVAALTHDRPALNALVNMTGGSTAPPGDMFGRSATTTEYTGVVVYAGDLPQYILDTGAVNNALCAVGDPNDGVAESPWPAGTFTGEIVVCDRGTYDRVEKSENAAFSGAGGFIHADSGGGEVTDFHVIPGIHIDQAEGQLVKDWVTAWDEASTDPQPTATITAAVPDPDSVAGFSSRGPNRSTGGDSLMPTIGAPGVSIWAAHGKYGEVTWTFLSGTSMASPHVAGSAALLKALHQDWTPAQIQSALETTAKNTGLTKEDSTTPADVFDVGSGRAQVDVAANAGLVLDEQEIDYTDADPASGGDPTTINNAHLANGECLLQCSFVRTVTSTAASSVEWTVTASFPGTVAISPSVFVIDPGASQDIQFEVDVSSLASNQYSFGQITLSPSVAGVPVAHFPMAIQPKTGELPGQIDLVTRRDAGSDLVRDLTAIEISDLVASVDGLVQADLRTASLSQDPTNGTISEVFDNLDDGTSYTELVDVPAGATHAVFEIVASESPDVDLWVGFDANDDGLASEDELVTFSASGTAFEKVVLDAPDEGVWWAVVQNWQESANTPDDITLATAVTNGSNAGNARVEGPASQTALDPFDLRVFWDIAESTAGARYYGWVSLGTDPGSPANIGTIPLTLTRLADDVTKTASTSTASTGDTIDYEISVLPNVLSEDLAYTLTDSIPEGLTYVDGSASATAGSLSVVDGVLTWTGTMPTAYGSTGSYTAFTNVEQPDVCAPPITGGYIDLAAFGIAPQAGIEGDGIVVSAFGATAPPYEFYEDPTAGINFTDDGFAFFDSTPGPFPFAPTPIGQPHWATGAIEEPNDMLAPFWTDMEIFFDAAAGRGVSLATLGDPVVATVIEFDDLEAWDAGDDPVPGAATLDFEIFSWQAIDDTPGAWEFAFAYDNVNGEFPALGFPYDLVIGLENEAGDDGTQVFAGLFGDSPISNGLVICFDYERPQFPPVTISYSVTVDKEALSGTYSNQVVSTVSNHGAADETTSVDVLVDGVEPPEVTARDQIQTLRDTIAEYPSTGNRSADRSLDRAVQDLDRALRDRYWSKDGGLDSRQGEAVFRWLALATNDIERADRRVDDDFSPWVDEIVAIARGLAADAIASTKAPGSAEYWFDRAERTDRAFWAVTFYGKAWDAATSSRDDKPWWR